MSALQKPKIGLLALTLQLYETLAPALRPDRERWIRQSLVPALEPYVDVLFERAVFRREDIASTTAEFERAGADALLVLLVSYSPSQLALPALKETRLPILIWNTQELFAVDEQYGFPELLANHGVHGTQDLTNVLLRAGVRFHYVTSHLRDPGAVREIVDFADAAAAVRKLRHARLGLLGYPFPGMGDFGLDTTHLVQSFGCDWTVLTVEDYIKRAAAASDDEVASVVAQYRKSYAVAPDITREDLELTARAELALRAQAADHGLSGLTYQFLAFGDDERTETLPFVGISRLMAEGFGFGGEGDLISAAATAFLNWLHPPASFSEMFTIDFVGGTLFMSHMGEANVAMARRDKPVALVARPAPITRTRGRQLALVTTFEPGPATLVTLTLGPGGLWRWIASLVTIENFGPLPSLCVPHFKIRPAKDVRAFLTEYAQLGGPHHNAICFGDARPRLRIAASLMNADYYEI